MGVSRKKYNRTLNKKSLKNNSRKIYNKNKRKISQRKTNKRKISQRKTNKRKISQRKTNKRKISKNKTKRKKNVLKKTMKGGGRGQITHIALVKPVSMAQGLQKEYLN